MFQEALRKYESFPSSENIKQPTPETRQQHAQHCQKRLSEWVITKYRPQLLIYLRAKLRSPDDAEDMVQEVCLRIYNYEKLMTIKAFDSFVFTIALNMIRDRSRRSYTKAAKHSVSYDDYDIGIETGNPARIVEGERTLEKLLETVNQLSLSSKEALLMQRIDGKSHKEIAAEMGVTVSSVEKYIMGAMRSIREFENICVAC